MTALWIILGILLFFLLLLSIKVKVLVHSEESVEVKIKWLFLKFDILPPSEKKKPKKEKKPKEKKKDETVKEPGDKENIFVRFYHNNGISGVLELLEEATRILGGMFKRVGRAFLFEEIYIFLLVGAGDSADTAIRYGKTCAAAFPAMGTFVSMMRVKKHNLEIHPNFIDGESKAKLHANISVRPIALVNAALILAFAMLFKVLIKFLMGARVKENTQTAKEEI